MANSNPPSAEIKTRPAKFDEDLFRRFIVGRVRGPHEKLNAVSLFSGGGVGDFGYHLAGFKMHVLAEVDPKRCDVIRLNYPDSSVLEVNLKKKWSIVTHEYRSLTRNGLDLLVASPPCQGLTTTNQRKSHNPWTHEVREDARNNLYNIIPQVAEELRPRVVVVENVPTVLVTGVRTRGRNRVRTVGQALSEAMQDYNLTPVSIQMANYGVPQTRERIFFIFVRENENWLEKLDDIRLIPAPAPSHGPDTQLPWIRLREALSEKKYPLLDSSNVETARDPTDELHFVPVHTAMGYKWISLNPPNKGRSCYESLECEHCGHDNWPNRTAVCRNCHRILPGVPRVWEDGRPRPVRGRKTAYKRMHPDKPAPTITTASGHFSSDTTIHPWQNRVLSIRECADLQTIPRSYVLNGKQPLNSGLMRDIIGEAIPPWFTFNLGRILWSLLTGRSVAPSALLPSNSHSIVRLDAPLVAPVSRGPPVVPEKIPALNGR